MGSPPATNSTTTTGFATFQHAASELCLTFKGADGTIKREWVIASEVEPAQEFSDNISRPTS